MKRVNDNKYDEKKVRIFQIIFLVLFVIAFTLTMFYLSSALASCNKKAHRKKLSEFEESMVGEWILTDIKYINLGDGIALIYPSSSDYFNKFCEKFLNNTKFVFSKETKAEWSIHCMGEFVYKGQKTEIEWRQREEDSPAISFFSYIILECCDGKTITSGKAMSAITNTKGEMIVSVGTNMMYIFKKK